MNKAKGKFTNKDNFQKHVNDTTYVRRLWVEVRRGGNKLIPSVLYS